MFDRHTIEEGQMKPVIAVTMMLLVSSLAGCGADEVVSVPTGGTIAGIVLEASSHMPVRGATITTEPSTTTVVSDSAGSFTLGNVVEGRYVVTASCPGYVPSSTKVTVEVAKTVTGTIVVSPVNRPPSTPSLLFPADCISGLMMSPVLRWTCADPDGDSLVYNVYFGTDYPPTTSIAWKQAKTTSLRAFLKPTTTYYWNVVADDGHGHTVTGPVWRFTTTAGVKGTLTTEWVEVPSGPFAYGEGNATTTIPYTFSIMKYEVTNAQYMAFLQEAFDAGEIYVSDQNPNLFVEGTYDGDALERAGRVTIAIVTPRLPEGMRYGRIAYQNGRFTLLPDDSYRDHPVVNVTWHGAIAFARHYGLQLPTDPEWEKAARGSTGYDYPWGNKCTSADANYEGTGDPFELGTTPVGFYNGTVHGSFATNDRPSVYGAYDMAGNVAEWVNGGCKATGAWGAVYIARPYRAGSYLSSSPVPLWFHNVRSPGQNPDVGFRCVK
jgi:formylglycine-generating enzyme required for sulfatase activity